MRQARRGRHEGACLQPRLVWPARRRLPLLRPRRRRAARQVLRQELALLLRAARSRSPAKSTAGCGTGGGAARLDSAAQRRRGRRGLQRLERGHRRRLRRGGLCPARSSAAASARPPPPRPRPRSARRVRRAGTLLACASACAVSCCCRCIMTMCAASACASAASCPAASPARARPCAPQRAQRGDAQPKLLSSSKVRSSVSRLLLAFSARTALEKPPGMLSSSTSDVEVGQADREATALEDLALAPDGQLHHAARTLRSAIASAAPGSRRPVGAA